MPTQFDKKRGEQIKIDEIAILYKFISISAIFFPIYDFVCPLEKMNQFRMFKKFYLVTYHIDIQIVTQIYIHNSSWNVFELKFRNKCEGRYEWRHKGQTDTYFAVKNAQNVVKTFSNVHDQNSFNFDPRYINTALYFRVFFLFFGNFYIVVIVWRCENRYWPLLAATSSTSPL